MRVFLRDIARSKRAKFSPSSAHIPVRDKTSESIQLFKGYIDVTRQPVDFGWLFDDLNEYERLLRTYANTSLADARVFEIGFGARPYRLIALMSMGVDASGVDAEVPMLDGSLREVRAIYETTASNDS